MICHRCGATVPEELPICGSCGQDLTIPRSALPDRSGDQDATNPHAEISGRLELRDATLSDAQTGLPYGPEDIIADRYEIGDVIAEGPVGVVYSAMDLDMDVQIALKVVLSEYFPDASALTKFARAIAPAQALSHENIVRVFEMLPHESRFVVAQQLVMGRTLTEVLAERLPQGIPSPRREVRTLLTQIGEALAYVHPDNPHGALKPPNILILPAGLVLTDFCLAAAIDRSAYLAGHRHRRLPTRYLAPEFLAERSFDGRADLYSLSVIAFELLIGMPFPNDEARVKDVVRELPAAAAAALLSGLSRSPSRRPNDVDDLVEGLLTATEDGPIEASPELMAVGDSTNVLDISEVEVLDDEEDDPLADHDSLSEDYADTEEATDPTAGERLRLDADEDSYVKAPARDPWLSDPLPSHNIPPAEPPTDQFVRVDPASIGVASDPEGYIETADEVRDMPDIDVDGRALPGGPLAALRQKGPTGQKVTDALEEMDFEASLENALASAARMPPPPKQKKRKRGPGHDPDPDAMRNRPVAAGGEILAATGSHSAIPEMEEPGVSVMDQHPPLREGTAQIPIPERPRSRLGIWIGLTLFAIACAAATVVLILYQHAQEKKRRDEAARRRARLIAIARGSGSPSGMRAPDPNMSGTMALPLMGAMTGMDQNDGNTTWAGPCPPNAVRIVHRRQRLDFCIDRFEYPNRRGAQPQSVLDADEATSLCQKAGKRLCSREEWQRACQGKKRRLYSYGQSFQPGVCVTADGQGKKTPVRPSGSRAECRSEYDVYDLNGNMAEWVASSQLMGGSGAKPANQTTCQSDTGSGGTAYAGVRCCASPRK